MFAVLFEAGAGHGLGLLQPARLQAAACRCADPMGTGGRAVAVKIQIASDLHREAEVVHRRDPDIGAVRVDRGARDPLPPPEAFRPVPDRDVLVLAGDIGTGTLARRFVLSQLEISPAIYVLGNHEYYGYQFREDIDCAWVTLPWPELHYLVSRGVTIDGVRFWGAPWYSDLWGQYGQWRQSEPWKLAMFEQYILDFRYPYNSVNTWSLPQHIEAHRTQTEELRRQAGQVDVVITHWPPTKEAIHPKFDGDSLNPYFINDRENLVREIGAKLWISGHTHEAYDYQIGATRCLGNPTGYPGEERESRLFRPDRVVEASR